MILLIYILVSILICFWLSKLMNLSKRKGGKVEKAVFEKLDRNMISFANWCRINDVEGLITEEHLKEWRSKK